ncbi:MAG: hypothetical protein FGM32_03535 [Candidatus Kapabacteria bacterium]|nr:hypothetical protein [Candidatus Kapabacteria bacterium]
MRRLLLSFLAILTAWLDVSAICRQVTSEDDATPIGIIRNGGQWPDSVLALYHASGRDVWFTKSGVIRDSYITSGANRVGQVVYEPFGDAKPFDQTDSIGDVPITYIKGSVGSTISTVASINQSVRYIHPENREVTFRISRAGDLVRIERGITTLDTKLLRQSARNDKGQESVLAKASSVFTVGSYFGGPGIDEIAAMETLPDGTILIAGSTTQTMFPENLGGYSRVLGGNSDGFLARIDGSFRKIYRWTFIGGSGIDRIKGIAFDKARRICIVTQTDSYDMPVLALGYTPKTSGGYEAHIAVLDSTMSKLEMGTYHGGTSDDIPCCISADIFDEIVIAGTTTSYTGMPTTKSTLEAISGTYESGGRTLGYSFQVSSGRQSGGKSDGFIAIYTTMGQLRAARYYGDEGNDTITAMTTDKRGRIVFAGTTTSQTLTTVPIVFSGWPGRVPLVRSYAGGASDGFLVKMNRNLKLTQTDNDGNFVTYFGGNGIDRITAIDLGVKEDIFFVGSTTSNGFYRSSSIQSSVADKGDAYVGWLRTDGTTLDGFTYWGGSADDEALAVQADTMAVRVLFGGRTYSEDFPTIGAGSVAGINGEYDGFITALDFKRARFSTLVSGIGNDEVVAFTQAKNCDAVFALNTTSDDLPVTDSAVMRMQIGAGSYLSRYSLGEITLSTPKDGDFVCAGSVVNISWQTSGLSDTVRYFLEYRKVGASNWTTIAKSLRSKSTTWTVPRAIVPGAYEVRVTSQFGHASKTTNPITIDVNPAVSLRSSPPRDCEGASVRMVAIPANVVATFQWRRDGVNLSGSTDSVYVITSLDAGNVGQYDCVVGGLCSQSDTSKPLEVGVTLRPVIRSQPMSISVNVGERIRLGVAVDGAGMSYQWFRDSVKLKNAVNSEYIVDKATAADSGRYWCSVSNVCGTSVSDTAIVDVRVGTSVFEQRFDSVALRLLSPQPVSDELLIECRVPAETLSVCLTDLRGRQLIEPKGVTNLPGDMQTLSFPVSHVEPGLIFVILRSRERAFSLPVLIAR